MPRAGDPLLTTPARQLYADPAAATAQAIDKIAAARVWLLKEKPFFGVLARALVVEASLEVAAFRLLEDDRLRINPLVVLELIPHAVRAPRARRDARGARRLRSRAAREPLRWNVAHDYAIAPLLRGAGFFAGASRPARAPSGRERRGVLRAARRGRAARRRMVRSRRPAPRGRGAAGRAPSRAKTTAKATRIPAKAAPNDPAMVSRTRVSPTRATTSGRGGRRRYRRGAEPVEARSRELQWKMRLGAALEEEIASGGKTFGEPPAWIDELVRATIEPPPDWTATLQRSIAMLTRTIAASSAPHAACARSPAPTALARRRRHAGAPHRACGPARQPSIDTSASIDSVTLARFLGSLASIATAKASTKSASCRPTPRSPGRDGVRRRALLPGDRHRRPRRHRLRPRAPRARRGVEAHGRALHRRLPDRPRRPLPRGEVAKRSRCSGWSRARPRARRRSASSSRCRPRKGAARSQCLAGL